MEKPRARESMLKTWLIIFLLVLIILLQGQFAIKVVGDLGIPTWSYRVIRDVPGQSPYAIYKPLPDSQHIRGKAGE